MMGDDDIGRRQSGEPVASKSVADQHVVGERAPLRAGDGDQLVVRHDAARHVPRRRVPAVVVRPERNAGDRKSGDFDPFAVQRMDMASRRRLAQRVGQPIEFVAVEFMVARHVDDRRGEGLFGPFDALDAGVDIARQDHQIDVDGRRCPILELEMQVANINRMEIPRSNLKLSPLSKSKILKPYSLVADPVPNSNPSTIEA